MRGRQHKFIWCWSMRLRILVFSLARLRLCLYPPLLDIMQFFQERLNAVLDDVEKMGEWRQSNRVLLADLVVCPSALLCFCSTWVLLTLFCPQANLEFRGSAADPLPPLVPGTRASFDAMVSRFLVSTTHSGDDAIKVWGQKTLECFNDLAGRLVFSDMEVNEGRRTLQGDEKVIDKDGNPLPQPPVPQEAIEDVAPVPLIEQETVEDIALEPLAAQTGADDAAPEPPQLDEAAAPLDPEATITGGVELKATEVEVKAEEITAAVATETGAMFTRSKVVKPKALTPAVDRKAKGKQRAVTVKPPFRSNAVITKAVDFDPDVHVKVSPVSVCSYFCDYLANFHCQCDCCVLGKIPRTCFYPRNSGLKKFIKCTNCRRDRKPCVGDHSFFEEGDGEAEEEDELASVKGAGVREDVEPVKDAAAEVDEDIEFVGVTGPGAATNKLPTSTAPAGAVDVDAKAGCASFVLAKTIPAKRSGEVLESVRVNPPPGQFKQGSSKSKPMPALLQGMLLFSCDSNALMPFFQLRLILAASIWPVPPIFVRSIPGELAPCACIRTNLSLCWPFLRRSIWPMTLPVPPRSCGALSMNSTAVRRLSSAIVVTPNIKRSPVVRTQ